MIARLVCALLGHKWVKYERRTLMLNVVELYERCDRCDRKRGRA